MTVITLSGWGQPHNALANIAPNATHIDYAHAADAEEAMQLIAQTKADYIIGWSLGGQLAVRAVAAGLIRPQKLVLIATPYQFVAADAMGPETFRKFYASYQNEPRRTLHKAWELLHYEDARSDYIRDQLVAFDADAVLANDWLRWLSALEHFSCDVLDFAHFPPTLLVHGLRDKVVAHSQSECLAEHLPNRVMHMWAECGHAPHLHDAVRLRALIAEFVHV